jgi:hypothetical protein
LDKKEMTINRPTGLKEYYKPTTEMSRMERDSLKVTPSGKAWIVME